MLPLPRPVRAVVRLALASLAVAACEHSSPGRVAGIDHVGPFPTGLPRRLTFYTGNDRTPSVTGNVLVYARQGDAYANPLYAPEGRELCIAFLPVEGGTIQRQLCPHDLIPTTDTLVHTWYEPALSPDGKRIAFVWERGTRVGMLGFLNAYLMVTPVDQPTDTTQIHYTVNLTQPDDPLSQLANMATHITWADSSRLRFIATFEHRFKVKGGGAERICDTIWQPLTLMELNLATGTARVVPGGDSVYTYAPAPDGGLWVVRSPDSTALLHLDPATGTTTLVSRFSDIVLDLIAVDGAPVAVVTPVHDPHVTIFPPTVVRGGAAIERLDPSTGSLSRITPFPGLVHRLASVPGQRYFVAEIEPALMPFGMPPDLWLVEFP